MGIGELVCGKPDAEWSASDTFIHYTSLLNRFHEKLKEYRADLAKPEAAMFAAFCARVILENSATILSGRLDPFRMMAIRSFQSQRDFDHGKQLKAGYKWTPDVVPMENETNIWKKDVEGSKLSRALFSPYFEELFWRPAFTNAVDYVDDNGFVRSELMQTMEPDQFIGRMKSELSRLYSVLSKGVHWDYLAPEAILDPDTLLVALDDSQSYVALLAFTSHFIPTSYGRIAKSQAYQLYSEI
ncbi:hypothetical protein [Aurantimonas sp. Leaf443]|uniref:hypothetical protein n=1 Tax=Aurantimonas sp. Leaf443 TaxID=1736378 RepID=UPI0012E3A73C|nr:hypothetical protein [Aurantimonas sp. Leaf443]